VPSLPSPQAEKGSPFHTTPSASAYGYQHPFQTFGCSSACSQAPPEKPSKRIFKQLSKSLSVSVPRVVKKALTPRPPLLQSRRGVKGNREAGEREKWNALALQRSLNHHKQL
jgi:hypothetical protein